jgi:hypothetical protein
VKHGRPGNRSHGQPRPQAQQAAGEGEYSLQTGVKERISNLTKELEVAQATLRKVPWDELDEQVRGQGVVIRHGGARGPDSAEQEESLLKRLNKMANFFKKTKARRKTSSDIIMDIMSHLQEVTERCRRYKVSDIVARPATVSTSACHVHTSEQACGH